LWIWDPTFDFEVVSAGYCSYVVELSVSECPEDAVRRSMEHVLAVANRGSPVAVGKASGSGTVERSGSLSGTRSRARVAATCR
jgi:hypothetical protein